jgi:NTP pyrophosphatase (non-canonical NTP hydrolase)
MNHTHIRLNLQELIDDIHYNAKTKGWWDQERNVAEGIALMHSELSEALEAARKGFPPDDKVPYDNFTVELADCVIRIFDLAGGMELQLAEALLAKHEFNKSRPYKHGKKF